MEIRDLAPAALIPFHQGKIHPNLLQRRLPRPILNNMVERKISITLPGFESQLCRLWPSTLLL
jgi:hypothetical protein